MMLPELTVQVRTRIINDRVEHEHAMEIAKTKTEGLGFAVEFFGSGLAIGVLLTMGDRVTWLTVSLLAIGFAMNSFGKWATLRLVSWFSGRDVRP